MTSTITAPVDSTIFTYRLLSSFNPILHSILKDTATDYQWESDSGEIVKLRGAFTYLADGSLDYANSSVTTIRLFGIGSTDFDLEIDRALAPIEQPELEVMMTGSNYDFWATVLEGSNTFDLHGDGEAVDLGRFNQGFTADGVNSTNIPLPGSDTMNITGSGTFSGDYQRVVFDFLEDDTINVMRSSATSDIHILGDAVYSALIGLKVVTAGNDTITDTSTAGGLTYLVGDIHMLGVGISVTGGNDLITGADLESYLVGDFWILATDDVLDHVGGNDTLYGGDVASTLVGDVYDADSDGALLAIGTAQDIVGGDDLIVGGDGNDTIYGEYVLMDLSSFTEGHDTIEGGKGADDIYGQTGDDSIDGQGGSDTIEGGKGDDTINGGNKADVISGGNAEDSLSGGKGADTITGDDGNDNIFGDGGSDHIEGGKGADTIEGGDDNDVLEGGGGNDTIEGGKGDDTLLGGDDDDLLEGGKGDDQIEGEKGADTLNGQNGNDVILGGKGDDVINGNDGADTITGGDGDDSITGGNGADVFVFENGNGNDTITDFDATNNSEDIDLTGVTAIADFADLAANHMTQSGADVVIDDGANLALTLSNVALADLNTGDFLF